MKGKVTASDVFLFYPNIIGYARLVLMIGSFACMNHYHVTAILLHLLSVALDFIDGPVARRYNQCTKFGEMLDLGTDTAAIVGLCIKLSQFYSNHTFLMQIIGTLLFLGSWTNLHAATATGAKYKGTGNEQTNPILDLFYTEPLMTISVLTTETFFVLLYVLHFTEGFVVPGVNVGIVRILLFSHIPIISFRVLVLLAQLFTASKRLASFDAHEKTSNEN